MVLKPDTAAKEAKEFLPACDIVLLMTVEPGFGGQSFRHDVLPKIEQLDTWRAEMRLNYRLEIDGGVDLETAPLLQHWAQIPSWLARHFLRQPTHRFLLQRSKRRAFTQFEIPALDGF